MKPLFALVVVVLSQKDCRFNSLVNDSVRFVHFAELKPELALYSHRR